MTKNIALCGMEEEPERRGDVNLAYFLRDGPPGVKHLAERLLSDRTWADVESAACRSG